MRIEIIVDSVPVVGLVTYTGKWDMTVELVEPFSGLHRDLHIMVLARSAPGLRDGLLSLYGDRRARDLLRDLYETAKALRGHSPLLHAIGPYLERVQLIEMSEDEYRQRRAGLRRQLRDGLIDNREHSILQQQLKHEKERREDEVNAIKDEFVSAHVPTATPINLRDQVWASLASMLGGAR